MELILFLLGLCITAQSYLLVPTILCICKKKLTLKQIRKIIFINGAIVWLIFTIIQINEGIEGTSSAVFLWSTVGYFLLKKKCLDANNQ